MEFEYIYPMIVLFGSFFIMLALSVPITFAVGLSTLLSITAQLPFNPAISVVSQKLTIGLDGFTLLAIPFFILAGNIMNTGGIAKRLVNFTLAIVGIMPGALALCNILANTLFGAISGSAAASAAAVGTIMSPLQKEKGYDPNFSAAVNISSAPIGLLIPPSNVLIVYSLASGGTSVATLFLAGYIPGLLMAVALMIVAFAFTKMKKYPVDKPSERGYFRHIVETFLPAAPSLFLIVVIIGGILGGVFTPTEASAVAVVYTLVLATIYREINLQKLRMILIDSATMSSVVLMLVGTSMGMSWAMTNADVPYIIAEFLAMISENPLVVLLVMNLILLLVGVFMDIVPALLIFTPIFLPIAQSMGIDTIQFGIMMVLNLSIGLCTPPVGTILFVGCGVGGVTIDKVLKPLIPLYMSLLVVLALVCYFPQLSLWLPKTFM